MAERVARIVTSTNLSVEPEASGVTSLLGKALWVRILADQPVTVRPNALVAGDSDLRVPAGLPLLIRHPGEGRPLAIYNAGDAAATVNLAEVDII